MNAERRAAPAVPARRELFALAALASVAVLLAVPRDAAAWTPLDPVVPRWAELPVGYYVDRSTAPEPIAGIAVDRVDGSFAAWMGPACAAWQTRDLGDTTDSYNYRDGKNVIRWISGAWPGELGPSDSVIGVTMPVWGADEIITDADMVFNNVGFCWDDNGSGDCVDTRSIVTHEGGHFLGLGHSSVGDATMVAFYVKGSSLRSLAADDVEGVCALYPIGGTAVTSTGADVSSCQGCFDASASGACASAYADCAGSAPCAALNDCVSECSDDACVQACDDAGRAGVERYVAMVRCFCSDCAAACDEVCRDLRDVESGAGGASPAATSGTGGGDAQRGDAGRADAGCSCTAGRRSTGLGGVLLLAALGALAVRRRRG